MDVRERVVFPVEEIQPALRRLAELPGVEEAAVISTCNRTELYAVTDADTGEDTLLHWLCREHGLDADWLLPHIYFYRDRDAVGHLLRVTPGLDSMVLGEPQIGGQTKSAYMEAMNAGTVSRVLDRLFQHAFSVSKHVRTNTTIGENPVSVAFAAVSLARQIFGDLDRQTALVIGAGETIDLTVRHLREAGLKRLIVANRSVERARELAERHGGRAIALGELPSVLEQADIVAASTASPLPLLGKGSVEAALRQRKHKPMFMVDLAVPRDIEPQVGDLDDVYLYTVDDLKEVVEENLRSRQEAARQAEEIIEVQTDRFMSWMNSLDTAEDIKRYRAQSLETRDAVLDQARQRLNRGDSPEAVLDFLAHTLTNKLIHAPTSQLRSAAEQGRDDLVQAARYLLNIGKDR